MTGQPKYNTALYLRLSKDDGTMNESSSIQTQKEMLTRYCRENGFAISKIYIDDGWSGTNTNRPSFQRMLSDIEDGKINCVITKDLSRLGRNYLETGSFTEIYFPEHNVRYIAVTDGVDTAKGSTMDITPFKNLLNDMYAQDISKKIKSSLLTRQKQGKFIGTKAPYGYVNDPADKNHLLIDERFAPIVRYIYKLAKDGIGITQIARRLTKEKIPRPVIAAAEELECYDRYITTEESSYKWTMGSVREILRNPVYKGAIRGQKRPKISLKSEKRKPAQSAGTFVVEGMHEAIIDPEEWELVQRLITSRKKVRKVDVQYDNIFSGLVKCADCGFALTYVRAHRNWNSENILANYDYQCNNYRMEGKSVCTQRRITALNLYNAVLADIKRLANEALGDDKQMISSIAERLGKAEKDTVRQAERELKRANKRLSELDRLFAKLYEEHINGKVSERNYNSLSAAYETEQTELESRISELNSVIKAERENGENAENFVDLIKQYADIDELTQALLNTLIDRIEVHEPEDVDGEFIQKLDVYYKFVGRLD